MQEIRATMDYVHAERDLRKPGSQGAARKAPLLDITQRVTKCIQLFKDLPMYDRKTLSKNMTDLAKDFNKILLEEGSAEVKKLSAFHETITYMSNIAPKVQIVEPLGGGQPVRSGRHLTASEAYRARIKDVIMSQINDFFSGNDLGGHHESRIFANDVLDALMAKKENDPTGYAISPRNLKELLLQEANRKYSPLQRRAEEVFSEEELEDVAEEYYRAVGDEALGYFNEDYPYQNFDQALLEECLERYGESLSSATPVDPSQSWKNCPLIHYRVGNTAADFEEFKEALGDVTKFFEVAKNLQSLNSSMTPVINSSDEEYGSSSDDDGVLY